ncbi:glycosyltransferase [Paraferrimonas sedimenticola]|uniref:Glycosyl transferase n=1 Tax=Paraferrimonas sedimenticola TaxID=375674 RepID=A0AA37RTT9_9GAMM|nr:glycosyltransferase [Paraferrimonas sedimenticola]GLP95585.1 glycosyl transferase [Paraferrimonas sedimenticola]
MPQNQNILIVIDSLSGGGAEKTMIRLAQVLVNKGHSVHFIPINSSQDYPVPDSIGVSPLTDISSTKTTTMGNLGRFRAQLKALIGQLSQQRPFDLILSNLENSNYLLAGLELKNLVIVVHNTVTEELRQERRRGPFKYFTMRPKKLCMHNQHLVCVSNGVQQDILEWGKITPKSLQTIYNPLNQSDLLEAAKLAPNDLPKEPYIIHVGRFARTKRHDLLMKMMQDLKSNVKLVCLCSNPKKVMALAKKFGVESRVIAPGFQPKPYPWIANAQAMVLVSDFEGLPTVLIESLALGTQVISSNCPSGPAEILTGELARNLVPMDQRDRFAEYVDSALNNPVDVSDCEIVRQSDDQYVAQQYLDLIPKLS